MADDIRFYLWRGRRVGIDPDDIRQEYELGRLEGGQAEGLRRARRMIRAASREPGPRNPESVAQDETYRLDPRNELAAAAIAAMPPLWRRVLSLRHGLDRKGSRPWSVTARALGIRVERAREIHAAALAFIARYVGGGKDA